MISIVHFINVILQINEGPQCPVAADWEDQMGSELTKNGHFLANQILICNSKQDENVK